MSEKVQQATAVFLYIIGLILWLTRGFWELFAFLFLLHLVELFLKGWKVGRRVGKTAWVTILMTLLLGYTWWLPLERISKAQDQGETA